MDLLMLVLGLALLAAGGLFFRRHHGVAERARHARSWPSVEGLVLSVDVRERHGWWRRGYEPRVHFEYAVDGRSLSGRTIRPGGEIVPSRIEAEQRIAKYPVGAKPLVRYDPVQPEDACLEPVHEMGVLRLAGVIFGVAFGTALLVAWLVPGP